MLFITVGLPESNGYIYVEANGGLNQQRTSVKSAPDVMNILLNACSFFALIAILWLYLFDCYLGL